MLWGKHELKDLYKSCISHFKELFKYEIILLWQHLEKEKQSEEEKLHSAQSTIISFQMQDILSKGTNIIKSLKSEKDKFMFT